MINYYADKIENSPYIWAVLKDYVDDKLIEDILKLIK